MCNALTVRRVERLGFVLRAPGEGVHLLGGGEGALRHAEEVADGAVHVETRGGDHHARGVLLGLLLRRDDDRVPGVVGGMAILRAEGGSVRELRLARQDLIGDPELLDHRQGGGLRVALGHVSRHTSALSFPDRCGSPTAKTGPDRPRPNCSATAALLIASNVQLFHPGWAPSVHSSLGIGTPAFSNIVLLMQTAG